METVIENVHQDRNGKYRSVSKATYKKLKKAKFFAHVARIQQARHDRWSRKLPHNRILWTKEVNKKLNPPVVYWTNAGLKPEPEMAPEYLSRLETAWERSKRTYDSPEKVRALDLTDGAIDALIANLYAWSDRVYGKRQ